MTQNKYRTLRYWMNEWIYPFLIALFFATLIRVFIVQPFKIPSTSMYPTLKVGDRIFVSKFIYGAKVPFINKKTPAVREPRRGDIVVFVSATDLKYPEPEEEYIRIMGPVFFNKDKKHLKWYAPRYLVKRLIGLPGDKIQIKDGDVYVNDEVLDEPFIIKTFNYFNAGEYGNESKPITVPEGSYFLLGDNSANSVDSRFWGFVSESHLTGKAFIIWWPVNRIRLIK